MTQDKLWGWFNDIRDKGILLSDRTNNRKSGSIVMYDSTNAEIARFNFTNGWPRKISTDQLSVESNDPVKETITLTVRKPRAGQVSLKTQYEFTLPRGYVDRGGGVHRDWRHAPGDGSGRVGAAARPDGHRAGRPAADGADPGPGGPDARRPAAW